MTVNVPADAGVACWVVDGAGRRVRRVTDGPLEIPPDGVVEVRGFRNRPVRLEWLAAGGVPVFSIQLGSSAIEEADLAALFELPQLAVLGIGGPAVTPRLVARLPELRNLAALDLKTSGLRAHDFVPLAAVVRLRRVSLEVPDAHAAGVVDLLFGRRLTGFGLMAPPVDADLLTRIVRQWPLRTLSLTVTRLDRAILSALAMASGLESVSVNAPDGALAPDDVRRCVEALPRLAELDLTVAGNGVPVEILLPGWQVRPGIRMNGLALDERAATRLYKRLTLS